MKNQRKRLVAILGAAILAVCQGSMPQVSAQSINAQAADTENQEEKVSVEAPQWNDSKPGWVTFKAPYEKETAYYKPYLYYNGEMLSGPNNDMFFLFIQEKGDMLWFDESSYFFRNGVYEFKLELFDSAFKQIGSVTSPKLEFTLPNESIPVPTNVVWNEDGTFSCDVDTENRYIDGYEFSFYDQNGEELFYGWILLSDASTEGCINFYIQKGIVFTKTQQGISFNLNEYMGECGYAPSDGYSVRVKAYSKDRFVYQDSDFSDPVYWGGVRSQSPVTDSETNNQPASSESESVAVASQSNTSEEPAAIKVWQPTTPDELKRYAVYGREKLEFTADTKGAYDVVIQNAMQGSLCFDSFESVLGDRIIARTYNILPSGEYTCKMEQKARISLQIPAAIQAEGRAFQMICVTENGVPVILNDLDSDPATITFETDTYYAFALVYKDK